MDQALRIYREHVLPNVESRRGHASSLVFSCKQKNELVACTLWETHDAMVEADRSGFLDQQIAKLSGVLAKPAEGDEYELEIFS